MNRLEQVARWGQESPGVSGVFERDAAALSTWHEAAAAVVRALSGAAHEAVEARAAWRQHVRQVHGQFLRRHARAVFDQVAASAPWRAPALLAARFPWLVATPAELEHDAARCLRDKFGFEYKDAVLWSEWLADAQCGRRLLDLARAPTAAALDALPAFGRSGVADLGAARIQRQGPLAIVELSSPDALNAEDESVLNALEACVDLALLDERIQLGVLRGAPVRNEKYAGRRVFCSGINLNALYEGKLSYLYYVRRELGLVSKLYRGLYFGDGRADSERPWMSVVDAHAIGGGCQLLLVMDYVIAQRGAKLSLPAKHEGILPGAANLRLPRFVGERQSRRLLMMDELLVVGSAEAGGLVDEIVAPEDMSGVIDAAADRLLASGLVAVLNHRKALRVAGEPEETFRAYMAHFAAAQAECHFGPALVQNLERSWLGRQRAGRGEPRAPSRSEDAGL